MIKTVEDWQPVNMLNHLHNTKQAIHKARVQCGGHGTGTVVVFITQSNGRFVYQMPDALTAKRAVGRMIDSLPEKFPLKLTSESADRAVYKRVIGAATSSPQTT
jgi:hypothetical protein